jgi:hypothetical protein
VGGILALVALKSFKSVASVPIGIVLDDVALCCHCSTFLNTKVISEADPGRIFIKGYISYPYIPKSPKKNISYHFLEKDILGI